MNAIISSKLGIKWLNRISRFLVGGAFLYTSLFSVLNFTNSREIIAAYGLLPDVAVLPLTVTLIFLGIISGVATLIGKQEGLLLSAAILLSFIMISGYGISIGLDIDCGCLAANSPEYIAFSNLRANLVRNIVLLILLTFSYWFTLQQKNLENYE